MLTGKLYKYALVLLFIISVISCSKTEDPATPGGDVRDKLVGTWVCNEKSKLSGTSSYNITISKSTTSSDGIIIKNFYQQGANASNFASVDGNSITITAPYVGSNTIRGGGTYSSSSNLTFTYTVDDGQKVDSVTATCHM